jgi:hypothetical protein
MLGRSPTNAMETRYRTLVAAVERAIKDADPIVFSKAVHPRTSTVPRSEQSFRGS